jgi:hypothetical protein
MPHDVVGRLRIVAMEGWEREAFELLGPAVVELRPDGSGELRFIAIEADVDWKPTGDDRADFSWEGNDECDPASGRGWVERDDDGSLRGHVFIHLGDDSTFRAVKYEA